MLFNSFEFAIFLPLVFIAYWFVFNKHVRAQNSLIVFASYIFYGWWDWRFLTLILLSTIVDYAIGIFLSKTNILLKRKILLWISIAANLGILGVFKYYNFFIDSFVDLNPGLQYVFDEYTLNILLPVGISFYTFQTMSYTIDVYRRKLDTTYDFIVFAAYVSFFPQLVAGPIERASNLLPQFKRRRTFTYHQATDGLRQMLWGFFKKIVIADNCAVFANMIFNDSENYNGSTLFIGALFFTFQIYGDFSGYSDIAIGTARLFGFNLMKNFAYPYFSRDIAEFWRRWHISLSTWFRDYLYIPLGGSRGGLWMKIRNTFIIFIVSGFWHGANWTFIVWGFLNALYFLPVMLLNKNRINIDVIAQGKILPSLKEAFSMALTFLLTVIAWIFFRADSIGHAISYLYEMFSKSLFEVPKFDNMGLALQTVFLINLFVIIEWFGRSDEYAIEKFGLSWHRSLRLSFYVIICLCVFLYLGNEQEFIYFQF